MDEVMESTIETMEDGLEGMQNALKMLLEIEKKVAKNYTKVETPEMEAFEATKEVVSKLVSEIAGTLDVHQDNLATTLAQISRRQKK